MFFYVNKEYLDYLRNVDSHVMKSNGEDKFVFGLVFTIKKLKYYIPVSSIKNKNHIFIDNDPQNELTTNKSFNKRIMIITDENSEKKAMLRFDYMIPIPDSELKILNIEELSSKPTYKLLVQKEFSFCRFNLKKIKKKAICLHNIHTSINIEDISNMSRRLYGFKDSQINTLKESLNRYACNFEKLENACLNYNS